MFFLLTDIKNFLVFTAIAARKALALAIAFLAMMLPQRVFSSYCKNL
ncbi:MAG: hypothetical protein AB1589_40385 [Cyanobacteriota bacterium]